jgi:hypothetical protein
MKFEKFMPTPPNVPGQVYEITCVPSKASPRISAQLFSNGEIPKKSKNIPKTPFAIQILTVNRHCCI